MKFNNGQCIFFFTVLFSATVVMQGMHVARRSIPNIKIQKSVTRNQSRYHDVCKRMFSCNGDHIDKTAHYPFEELRRAITDRDESKIGQFLSSSGSTLKLEELQALRDHTHTLLRTAAPNWDPEHADIKPFPWLDIMDMIDAKKSQFQCYDVHKKVPIFEELHKAIMDRDEPKFEQLLSSFGTTLKPEEFQSLHDHALALIHIRDPNWDPEYTNWTPWIMSGIINMIDEKLPQQIAHHSFKELLKTIKDCDKSKFEQLLSVSGPVLKPREFQDLRGCARMRFTYWYPKSDDMRSRAEGWFNVMDTIDSQKTLVRFCKKPQTIYTQL